MMTFGIAVKAVIRDKDKYLIVTKSDIEDIGAKGYDLPGGRLEFGETPANALKREVREETGLEITIVRLTRAWTIMPKPDLQIVGLTYLCELNSGTLKLSREHENAEWHTLAELRTMQLPAWITEEYDSAVGRG